MTHQNSNCQPNRRGAIAVLTALTPLPLNKPQASQIILVVEDNPDNMTTITAILDEMGCSYITAEDGQLAVKVANESCPGLILMDIQLPGLSGLDATRQIKMNPVLSHIPIIALTARAMKGDRETALAAGCDDYLTKPLDPASVIAVIRKWMPDTAPVCGSNTQHISGTLQ